MVSSRSEFHRLFVFGDDDCGDFTRFQAKYDMLLHGGVSARFHKGEVSLSVLIENICRFIHRTIAAQRRQNLGYIEQRMNDDVNLDEIAWVPEHHHVSDDAMAHIIDLSWSSRSEVLSGRPSQR